MSVQFTHSTKLPTKLKDALDELEKVWTYVSELRQQLHEANARAAVCVNVLKAAEMHADGKIDDATLDSVILSSVNDLLAAEDWLNGYVGKLTEELAVAQKKLATREKRNSHVPLVSTSLQEKGGFGRKSQESATGEAERMEKVSD